MELLESVGPRPRQAHLTPVPFVPVGVESCQTTPRLQLSRKPLALRPLSNFNSLKVESLHPNQL